MIPNAMVGACKALNVRLARPADVIVTVVTDHSRCDPSRRLLFLSSTATMQRGLQNGERAVNGVDEG